MKPIFFLLLTLALATGCKKSQPTGTTPTPAPENANDATPAPGTPAAPANQAGAAPAIASADTTKALNEVDVALKAKDYQKAAETLMAIQRQKQLTEQQAAALHGQMVQLQGAVAAGVASGDPRAKAAAEQLRASAMQP